MLEDVKSIMLMPNWRREGRERCELGFRWQQGVNVYTRRVQQDAEVCDDAAPCSELPQRMR